MKITKNLIILLGAVIILVIIISRMEVLNVFDGDGVLDHTNSVESNRNPSEGSVNSSLDKYDLSMDFPMDWDGYQVFEDGQTPDSSLHNLMIALDSKYFTLRIRHPKWTEEIPYQDVVFSVFRVKEWNKNASKATNDDVSLLPELVHFTDAHVFVIDPNNYNMDLPGYRDILLSLLKITYMEHDEGAYRVLEVVRTETDSVMYEEGVKNIRVKWQNHLEDVMVVNGSYVLEKARGDRWEEIASFEGEEAGLIPGSYEIFEGESDWFDYALIDEQAGLVAGEYRVGINYTRASLYGLEFLPGESPNYRVYDDFIIGQEDILRETKAEDQLRTLEGVGIETEYEIYEAGVTEVRVKWYNTVNDNMLYGEQFTVEKQDGVNWKPLKPDSDVVFISIGYILEPQTERWHKYQLLSYSNGLKKGSYRISTKFHRKTYDGVSFGAGNYPEYQIYGYFEVGKKSVERSIINLHEGKYEYLNSDYGIAIYFTEEWEGLKVVLEGQDLESPMHDILFGLDQGYSLIRIKHPKSGEDQYQDIVLVSIRRNLWNRNAERVVKGDLKLLPDTIHTSSEYLLAIDPYHYNQALLGYEEVMEILESGFKGY